MSEHTTTEIRIRRGKIRETSIATRERAPIADGEVLVEIERFALTANNVSYALTGDMLGYWQFFPTEDGQGLLPVWGIGRIVESRATGLAPGEKIWGFLPMASHVVLRPGELRDDGFVDAAPHRRDLPAVYNAYRRSAADPPELRAFENERCLLLPLFTTAFILDDWLGDNGFFGAKQVLIGSASSKTGIGLADLLWHRAGHPLRVVGLSSEGNLDFVRGLGICDEVRSYGKIRELDATIPSAFVDMSGSATVLRDVHGHFGDALKLSCQVGATHWQQSRRPSGLAGPEPQFFFAPGQLAKREVDWGPGELLRRATIESMRIAKSSASGLTITLERGPEACLAALDEMIDGRTSPKRGVMLSLNGE